MDRKQMKLLAKDDLRNTPGYITAAIIYFVISLVLGGIVSGIETKTTMDQMSEASSFGPLSLLLTLISLAAGFALMIIAFGFVVYCLKAARRQRPLYTELFSGFQKWANVLAVNIMVNVFTFLWSLLLIVPGIIKSYSYSMSNFILADNPDMNFREVIKKSREMMNGHKMDYFVLTLSFIPWMLLVVVTFGIASIWVAPYIQTTASHFYESIKNQ